MRHRGCFVIVVAVVSSLFGSSVAAWEEDLHYGLTKWLALQAGFAEPHAQIIAAGDVGTDRGILDARHLVFWYACLSKDQTGFELARDFHFPAFQLKPSPPKDRVVEPGGAAAMRLADNELKALPATDAARSFSLQKLGVALHVLQDSWSHQGEPQIPTGCSNDFAWAHPKGRGRWDSHEADWTWRHAGALEAAERTYDVLVTYVKANPWAMKTPPRDWPALIAVVKEFANCDTKAAKRLWFRLRNFNDVSFVELITLLPGDGSPVPPQQFQNQSASMIPAVIGTVPSDARNFISEFWKQWISATDFAMLANTFLAQDRVAASLGVTGVDPRIVSRTALGMWRVRDHGLVAARGHTLPSFARELSNLDKLTANQSRLIRLDGLSYGMLALDGARSPIAIAPAGGGRYVGFGRFRHAPYDVVRATAEQVNGRWRITEIGWVVEH